MAGSPSDPGASGADEGGGGQGDAEATLVSAAAEAATLDPAMVAVRAEVSEAKAPKAPPVTLLAGRFELEKQAGVGGMGVVYRALDRWTAQPVALKMLHSHAAETRERFAREASSLAELLHPNIVRYAAHGVTEDGTPYLAMEWLSGIDLAERLCAGPLTLGETVRMATSVAGALSEAHRRGFVHRDIKPSNIFLEGGEATRPKLLDFGIARHRDTQRMTRTGHILGTPAYMAPEQVRGSREIDARADLFSLGCILFECVAGRPPFQGEHPVAVLMKVLLDEPPRLSELRPDVPPGLGALVQSLLAKDPAERASSADEVRLALEALDLSAEASLPPASQPVSLTTRERRLFSVVMVGGASLGARGERHEREQHEAIRQEAEPLGVSFEELADGSLVAFLRGEGVATDQAAKAARCALAVHRAVPEAVIALATGRGEVSSGSLVGHVVDRSAALLDAAARAPRAGALMLDEVTAGLLDGRFDVGGDSQHLWLRGLREEEAPTRTLLGKPTPCVGREREVAFLLGLYEESVAESVARAALVTGPAGVGKSRLRHELLRRLAARDEAPVVWMATADAMTEGSPFGLLGRLVRRIAGILDGEALSVRRQKLRGRVARSAALDVARVSEFLGELSGVAFPEEGSVQLRSARRDAMVLGDQMRRAWEDFVVAEARERPLVLVFDDLQWGDLPSVQFVDAALRQAQDLPLLVLGFARPEVSEAFAGLWEGRGVQELRLGPLTRKASERLVRGALGAQAPDAVVARLVEQAAGNAFYLEELIRAVAEGRREELPATVLAMVEARLGALEPEARRVLRAGSIFGHSFWRGGAEALLADVEGLGEWLKWLVDSELLSRSASSRFPREEELIFRHSLLRDAAYASLADDDRRLGHRLAAEWLQQAGEPDPVVLAEHFERAEDAPRAAAAYRRAAVQALQGHDLDGAIRRAARALACGASGAEAGELRLLLAEAHNWRAEFEQAARYAAEAQASLSPGSRAWYEAAGQAGHAYGRQGDGERLSALVEPLHHPPDDSAARAAQSVAASRVTVRLFFAARDDAARSLLEGLLRPRLASGDEDPHGAAWILRALAALAAHEGDLEAFIHSLDMAVAGFEHTGDHRETCNQRSNLGYAFAVFGLYDEAERTLRDALAAAERMGLSTVLGAVQHNLGFVLARRGRLAEAASLEEAAIAFAARQRDARFEAASRIYMALIDDLRGDHAAAEKQARAAVERADELPHLRAYAQGTLAQTLLAQGRPADALREAQAAADAAERLGGIEDGDLTVRLALIEALLAAGHQQQATIALATAHALLHKRAARISRPDWRLSFLQRVPENARLSALAARWLGAETE